MHVGGAELLDEAVVNLVLRVQLFRAGLGLAPDVEHWHVSVHRPHRGEKRLEARVSVCGGRAEGHVDLAGDDNDGVQAGEDAHRGGGEGGDIGHPGAADAAALEAEAGKACVDVPVLDVGVAQEQHLQHEQQARYTSAAG